MSEMVLVLLYFAAFLAVAIGLAHSYLGERYILIRLFQRGNLPYLFGGPAFTQRTLRFAWHLTSVAWWGFAAILVLLAQQAATPRNLLWVMVGTFTLTTLVTFVGSKGWHLAWMVFLLIAVCTGLAAWYW